MSAAPEFPTHAYVAARRPIATIIAEAPEGQVPMFFVTEAYEDYLLSCAVYIKDGRVCDCITDERIAKRLITGLRFDRYINA